MGAGSSDNPSPTHPHTQTHAPTHADTFSNIHHNDTHTHENAHAYTVIKKEKSNCISLTDDHPGLEPGFTR